LSGQVVDEDGARIRRYGVTEANIVIMLMKRKAFWQCDAAMLSCLCFGGAGLNKKDDCPRDGGSKVPRTLLYSIHHGLFSEDWTGSSSRILFDLAMHTAQRKYCKDDSFNHPCLAKFGEIFDGAVSNPSVGLSSFVTERRPTVTCWKL